MSHSHHHHAPGKDYVEANKAHFNATDNASKYDDDPLFVEFASTVGAAMREAYQFDPSSTTVLDFACGTGITTRSYTSYVKSVLGVDVSEKMLDQYMKQAEAKGFADKMSCVCIELKGAEGELDKAQFDVITCSMAYHHFESIKDITTMLVKFLKPNGMLLVVDIEAPSNDTRATQEMEKRDDVAHHHGFGVDEIKRTFEGAGLVSFDMKHVAHFKFAAGGWEVDTFLAKGVKPANSEAL
ncbi:S-adenosyl-L-methionine-dependent methyltransferase [Gymnopus androsaceus JB14]|uniref:S-adenosyl-L-methionine-dependent methyltransferase n=1 Tax=Gymnopus androsaceus JB14 TaxID=1447944 RepID=A0A6A4HC70_9AGAR|nr:S-adenosyl-L-methionine-dependent methyltransferase [Gymnopus androsaceus JB14]